MGFSCMTVSDVDAEREWWHTIASPLIAVLKV